MSGAQITINYEMHNLVIFYFWFVFGAEKCSVNTLWRLPGPGWSRAPSQIFLAIFAIPKVEKDRIHRARGIFADLFEDELATVSAIKNPLESYGTRATINGTGKQMVDMTKCQPNLDQIRS